MSMIRVLVGASASLAFSAAAVAQSDGKVHRPARLFVSGDYPDKGCSVTDEDLDQICARFSAEGGSVPVKTEHADSPLDPLGDVVALYRQGHELYGMLCFSSGINQHIEERGVKDLSIGLVRENDEDGGGYRLTETSLVFKGRVPGAGFLSPEMIASKLAQFTAEGRLPPAAVASASRLLSAPHVVTFSDGSEFDVVAETLALLSSLPVVQRGRPLAGLPHQAPSAVAIAPETHAMAKGLGLAPDRLHGELQKQKGASA